MWGLLFRRSALIFLVFYMFVAICASFDIGQDHGILSHQRHHENPKHQSSKAYSRKHSPPKSPARRGFFLDRRDFVPKQYISVPIEKKQNIFEKHYENQGFPQMEDEEKIIPTMGRNMNFGEINIRGGNMKSNGENTRKINSNDLGYGDLKRVEDADQSVNDVINSIINDDNNLEKTMSSEAGYRKPTPGPSEDFDVAIDEYTAKNSGESSYVPTKLAPEVVKGRLQEASQVGDSDQTLHSSYGKRINETRLAHSWSVQLDSVGRTDYNQNSSQGYSSGSHGNEGDTKPLYEEATSSIISSQIGNTSIGGTTKEDNNSNVYSEVGDEGNDPFKQTLNSNGSVLSGGENKQIESSNNNIMITNDTSSPTKMLNLSYEATSYITKNNSLMDNTNLDIHGDEVTNNGNNQNFSNKINLPEDVSNDNSNITNVIFGPQGGNDPMTVQNVAFLGNRAEENSTKNSGNGSFDNKYSVGSGSDGNVTVTRDNNNGSKNNDGNVNVEIIEGLSNKDAQNGHLDNSNNSTISIDHGNTANTLEQNGKDSNDITVDNPVQNAATPSSFLKQHPNAFKILMEYFRKETSLQQKLRNRLNALRKTRIDENAIKKSFASVHELEAMPTRPLPLRDFVADLFTFATKNISPKPKSQNIVKTKASRQRFHRIKGKLIGPEKAGRRIWKPIVGAPRKIVRRPQNTVQTTKQSLPSRKADVTFLADFENVTEVAKEINGNITKIFQDAMNPNSQDAMASEPSGSSVLGLAEERIGKIIAQNEITQHSEENAESYASNEKATASFENNKAISKGMSGPLEGSAISVEAKDPDGSNTIKVEAIGPVESNAFPNTARRPLVNHSNAISKAAKASKESNSISKEASYSIGQTSPSEALYDFIHIKNSYMDSKTMMHKKGLKSLEVSLSQDFFNFWIYHYRSLEEMSIKPEQLRSGIATVGSTDRLERVIKKALKGEIINVLIVGGSISAGGGLERDRHDLHGIYYKAFVEWWKNTVTPITTSDLNLNVVAIGGTDSEYFSYCIKNYIQDQPDLVIWELAANDYRRYAGREMDPAKPLEQLTRLLLTLPSQPALIFINFFRGDYYKTTPGQDCPDSEDEGGRRMAEYYKITSLSWRNIICSQMKTDMRPSNGVKREFTPLTLKTLFSSDGYHPSLLGHAQCATLLISYIRSVFEEVVSREISRLDDGKADVNSISNKSNLPQPIYSDDVAPNPMCWTLITSDFHRQIENQLPGMRIMEANGFEFTNVTHWPVRMDRLRCLKALHSDASLRIKFDVSRKVNNKSSTKATDLAVISHNSFLGSARVWLDNDQHNAVNIEEPAGQRRTQANIIKRVLQPGSHVITIRSITPGLCVSALAIL